MAHPASSYLGLDLSWSKPLFESFWCHNDQLLSTIDAPAITMSLLLFTCLKMLLLFTLLLRGKGGPQGSNHGQLVRVPNK